MGDAEPSKVKGFEGKKANEVKRLTLLKDQMNECHDKLKSEMPSEGSSKGDEDDKEDESKLEDDLKLEDESTLDDTDGKEKETDRKSNKSDKSKSSKSDPKSSQTSLDKTAKDDKDK